MKCAIYGTGKWAETILHMMSYYKEVDIVYFVRSEVDNGLFHGMNVIKSTDIKNRILIIL